MTSTWRVLLFAGVLLQTQALARDCKPEHVGFELMTGYVYSAPADMMSTIPGVLELSECIDECRGNPSCYAVNFETGLCVLFAASPTNTSGVLTKSQFPVFTLFAQKTCVRASANCSANPWLFEVVRGQELRTYVRGRRRVGSRRECMELCIQEREFSCRSANYNKETGDCAMSDMDRFTVSGLNSLAAEDNVDYLESNCVSDPIKMCDFVELSGKLLKTADSVYQDVSSLEDCRQLCLQSPHFRCHTFDYNDTGEHVCRLSHHATASLQHIEEPYLDIEHATSHQLTACYNVTIDCRASDMVAHVRTNKVFNGKVYAKNRPNSCVADVVNSIEFDLRLGYNDLNCDIKQDALGRFSTDIIIQHHDQIVTSQDVGLSIRCAYSLQNRSVGHGVELEVGGELGPAGSEESSYVISPTVTMRITDRKGEDIHTAQVGDALSLRFHILDQDSPYQIFVRELIALDGIDSSEILLIDSLGCPTDPTIMGPISVVDDAEGAKVLQAPFDAFKFPTSDVVQFKALVTPCLPSCEPVVCDVEDYYGMLRRVDSYGKRKKREINSQSHSKQEEMLLVQSIRIADKFRFDNNTSKEGATYEENTKNRRNGTLTLCMNTFGLAITATIFLCTQLLLGAIWMVLWQRKLKNKCKPSPYTQNIRKQPWRHLNHLPY